MRCAVVAALLLGACGAGSSGGTARSGAAAVPPYTFEALSAAEHADVCEHTGEPASPDACEADMDCRICHDGSDCGVPANLTTMRARGAECHEEDAAECEYSAVRCCSGRCRVVSH